MTSRARRGIVRVGIAIACVAILGVVLGCDAPDREEARRRIGVELGLVYAGALPPAFAERMSAMPSLALQPNSGQNFFVRALTSDDLLVFDWVWREGPLKERNRESQTVVAIRLAEELSVAPFVWVERGRLGREDLRRYGEPIDWPGESPGESSGGMRFSDDYQVVGRDRRGLRDLFTPEARDRFVLPRGLRVEGAGAWLIGWRPGERLEAAELPAIVDAMRKIAARG